MSAGGSLQMIADCDVMDFTFSANDLFLCIATDGIHDCIHPAEVLRGRIRCYMG